jgi:hypothetical protein
MVELCILNTIESNDNFFYCILKLILKYKIFLTLIKGIWVSIFLLFTLMCTISLFTSKINLEKNDLYGEYLIDTNKCSGKQANWQYEHYKFEIKENNKMYFQVLNDNKTVRKTIIKNIEIKDYSYSSPRLDIKQEYDDFHIIRENPTLYREIWTYYYVFHSEKFGNMFFTKKKWYQF